MVAQEMYDTRAPGTAHVGLAASQFREHFVGVQGPVLNIAAGSTYLAGDLRAYNLNLDVVSLDPSYTDSNLSDFPGRVRGVAQDIPYPNESFALTLCQFGLQHMSKEDVPQAIREMARVTRSVDNILDESQGTILLGPVFKSKELAEQIYANGLEDVCGVETPERSRFQRGLLPTLIIKKTAALTGEKLERLITAATEVSAFHSRRTIGELAVRRLSGGFSYR